MLSHILKKLEWNAPENRKLIVFLDDSISEILKWNGFMDDVSGVVILSFDHDIKLTDLELVRAYNAERLLFILSDAYDNRIVSTLKDITVASGAPECIILTTGAPESVFPSDRFNGESPYVYLQDALSPCEVNISYLPLHTISLLNCTGDSWKGAKNVGLSVLSAMRCRDVTPVTLSQLDPEQAMDLESVNDVDASILPEAVKKDIRALSHEIAGALVFDIGVDPSASIYALGKTASLVGHNLLPILENCVALRSASITNAFGCDQGMRLYNALPRAGGLQGPLPTASLILVDRNEDLYTPAAHGGLCPLAHRIQSTLRYCQYSDEGRRSDSRCDISLLPLSLQMPDENKPDVLNDDTRKLCLPMSGVSGVPLQVAPSLCYNRSSDGFMRENAIETDNGTGSSSNTFTSSPNELIFAVMASDEDRGRQTLCAELKRRVIAEMGTEPPPKKRGLGAEVLAYAQALVEAPGRTKGQTGGRVRLPPAVPTGFSLGTCMRSHGLLSLSLAVVEAMQRSSGKQFTTVCDWQCSFDVRAAREAALDRVVALHQDLDVCVAHLVTYFALPAGTAATLKSAASTASLVSGSSTNNNSSSDLSATASGSGSVKKIGKPSTAKEKENPCAGPTDAMHLLLQLARLLFAFQFRETGSAALDSFTACLSDYLLHKSVSAEMDYLASLGFLSPATVQDVQQYRALVTPIVPFSGSGPSEDTLAQLTDAVEWGVAQSLRGLSELAGLYGANRKQRVEKGQTELAAKHLDLVREVCRVAGSHSTSMGDVTAERDEVNGLVARLVSGFLSHRAALQAASNLFFDRDSNLQSPSSSSYPPSLLEYIESPLQQMTRAGLGLLSAGLGRFGFGSTVAKAVDNPHPGEQETLAIFVIGGISYKEVGQVQALLDEHYGAATAGSGGSGRSGRVVLMANRTVSPENVFHLVYGSKRKSSSQHHHQ